MSVLGLLGYLYTGRVDARRRFWMGVEGRSVGLGWCDGGGGGRRESWRNLLAGSPQGRGRRDAVDHSMRAVHVASTQIQVGVLRIEGGC